MPLTAKVGDGALTGPVRSLHSGRRWYVAASQPGREDWAQLNIQRQGFVSWLPRQRRMVQRARKKVEKSVAFFPGYIFVSLDLATEGWRSINGTFGVRSLIMVGEWPAPCPHGLIENMQLMSDASGLVNEQSAFTEGGPVRVLIGPFAEMVGTLTRLEGSSRARVLLELMQSQVAVQMDVCDLTPLA